MLVSSKFECFDKFYGVNGFYLLDTCKNKEDPIVTNAEGQVTDLPLRSEIGKPFTSLRKLMFARQLQFSRFSVIVLQMFVKT